MVFNADVMRRQAAELDEELEHVRFTGRSRDGAVTVVVSGHGRLVDLTIGTQLMHGAHPQAVGPDVVEAVSAARRSAAGIAIAKMRSVLDKDQVWYPDAATAAVAHHPERRTTIAAAAVARSAGIDHGVRRR